MKSKTLKLEKCYINEDGSFVICLLAGNENLGYLLAASHVHPYTMLGIIHIQSRVVDNNTHWIEVPPEVFNIAASLHAQGLTMKIPAEKWRGSGLKYNKDGVWDRFSYMKKWAKNPPTVSEWYA